MLYFMQHLLYTPCRTLMHWIYLLHIHFKKFYSKFSQNTCFTSHLLLLKLLNTKKHTLSSLHHVKLRKNLTFNPKYNVYILSSIHLLRLYCVKISLRAERSTPFTRVFTSNNNPPSFYGDPSNSFSYLE